MNIVKVLTISVGLIASTAAVIENDNNLQLKHLRKKPVGASITQSSSSSSILRMPDALRSFLSWPANTFNVDDEHHHPLGSNYPLQQFDNTNDNNVLFSLKLSTKNSNMIRNHQRRRRHLSSVSDEDSLNLDISPAMESLEQQQQQQQMNKSAATTTHEDNHDGAHDSHDDAHDMVVHVTYEDICKCILFFVHMICT